jgi:hypothetical protein
LRAAEDRTPSANGASSVAASHGSNPESADLAWSDNQIRHPAEATTSNNKVQTQSWGASGLSPSAGGRTKEKLGDGLLAMLPSSRFRFV